jgi:hypothetical protein
MPRGGARPNSGPKKGAKYAKTIDKELAREMLRQLVKESLREMTEAQIANAMGLKFLMVREKLTGKFKRVGEMGAKALNPDEEIIEVWEKDPSVQAFQDLLDRTLDKPKQSVDLDIPKGLVISWKTSE